MGYRGVDRSGTLPRLGSRVRIPSPAPNFINEVNGFGWSSEAASYFPDPAASLARSLMPTGSPGSWISTWSRPAGPRRSKTISVALDRGERNGRRRPVPLRWWPPGEKLSSARGPIRRRRIAALEALSANRRWPNRAPPHATSPRIRRPPTPSIERRIAEARSVHKDSDGSR